MVKSRVSVKKSAVFCILIFKIISIWPEFCLNECQCVFIDCFSLVLMFFLLYHILFKILLLLLMQISLT